MRGARASGWWHGGRWGRRCGVAVAVLCCGGLAPAAPAQAAAPQEGVAADVQEAAQVATAQGYRTGVAVLDLETGSYHGASGHTTEFAAESVVKVLMATELLLAGAMTGATEARAYRMITASDDDAANALYWLAGGDDLVDRVAGHYGIAGLGSAPSRPGWWGNTHLTARGLVQLYAAIAADVAVGPWLRNAMAHTTEYGADGTWQFFGLPSATDGAAVKQGWGADGHGSADAVFNSTGYVGDGRYAVAILTAGPSWSYGGRISAVVTAQAEALLPGGAVAGDAASGVIAGPTAAAPSAAAPPATADDRSGRDAGTSARAASPTLPGGLLLAAPAGFAIVAGLLAARRLRGRR